MGDPRSEHTPGASPNDSHEQPIDAGKTNANPAARKPSNMDGSKGDGLQQESPDSGPERAIQSVQDHAAISSFFDRCIDHRKEDATGN